MYKSEMLIKYLSVCLTVNNNDAIYNNLFPKTLPEIPVLSLIMLSQNYHPYDNYRF